MAVEAGTRIGRFVIHGYLGQGDLGVLFRACGPRPGSVALKVLRGLAGAGGRARFLALARRLAHIRHPNLVPVLGFGNHDDTPYLVLQHVPAGALADRLRGSETDRQDVLRVLRGIAAGVDHAHHRGLVHGALKPQQVVIDGDDHPMVTDFGLAPLRWPLADGVTVAVLERNAAYAAPELVAGGQPSVSADRYAYATIAYELLTGRRPFDGEPHDVLNAQLDAAPPAPSSVDATLTPAIDAVLLRGLAKDPASRWRSCVELAEALAAACPPAPVPAPTAPEPPVVSAASPGGGQSRALRALGLSCVLFAAAVAAGATVTWLGGPAPIVAVVLSRATAHPGDALVVTATGLPAGQVGTVELRSDPERVGTFRADRDGSVRADVLVPEDATPGEHRVTLCWEEACHGSARLTILDVSEQAGRATSLASPLGPRVPPAHPATDAGDRPATPGGPATFPAASPSSPSSPMPTPTAGSTPRPTPRPKPTRRPRPSPPSPPSPGVSPPPASSPLPPGPTEGPLVLPSVC
jgi:hypothetical protein